MILKKEIELKDDKQSKDKDNIEKKYLMNSKGEEEDKKIEINNNKLEKDKKNPINEKLKENLEKNIIYKSDSYGRDNNKRKKNKKNKKEKNLTSDDSRNINNKNNSNGDEMKGDIDFIIPDLKGEELKKILSKKEFAPFLFYDK